jgi:hypothetical protein
MYSGGRATPPGLDSRSPNPHPRSPISNVPAGDSAWRGGARGPVQPRRLGARATPPPPVTLS